eukprot:745620-Hanusia_phi.AAC.3
MLSFECSEQRQEINTDVPTLETSLKVVLFATQNCKSHAIATGFKDHSSSGSNTSRPLQGNGGSEHAQTPFRLDIQRVKENLEKQNQGDGHERKFLTSRTARETSTSRKTSTELSRRALTSRQVDSASDKNKSRLFDSPYKSESICPESARKSIEPDKVHNIILRLDQNKRSLREAFLLLDGDRDGLISDRDWVEGFQKLDTSRDVDIQKLSGRGSLTFREFSKIADDCIDKSKFRQCTAPFLRWNPSQQYLRMWALNKPPPTEALAEALQRTPKRDVDVLEVAGDAESDGRERRRQKMIGDWEQRFESARKQAIGRLREREEMKRLTEIAKEDGMVARLRREEEAQARFFEELSKSVPASIAKPFAPEIHMFQSANATRQWYKGLGNAGSNHRLRMKM